MRLQVREPVLQFTPFFIALDRGRDGIQKILIAKWLGVLPETRSKAPP